MRTRAVAAIVLACAAAGAGAAWWSWPRRPPAAPPAAGPSAAEHAARDLLARLEQTDPGDAAALLAAADTLLAGAPFPHGADPEDAANHVAHCLSLHGRTHDAMRLLATLEQRQPRTPFGAGYQRLLAQVAWDAGDLGCMTAALQRGLARCDAADHFERALLLSVRAMLDASLGRVLAANRHIAAALEAAEASAAAGAPECWPMVAFAHCDLCLVTEDYGQALAALAAAPPSPRRALYEAIARMGLATGTEPSDALDALLEAPQLGVAQRAFAAAKAVQLALQRGDVDTAAERFARLRTLTPIDGDVSHDGGRTVALAIELTLRGHECVPMPELLPAARTALDGLVARGRAVLDRDRGEMLHLDDHCTLLANVMRLEQHVAAGPDGARRAFGHLLAAHGVPAASADTLLERLLGPGHGVLAYVPGRYATVLLCADGAAQPALATLSEAGELRPRIDELDRAVDAALRDAPPDPGAPDLERCADEVATLLLPREIADRLARWRRVSICGAGLLQNLRFELLPVTGADAARGPLGRVLPIDYPDNLRRAGAATAARGTGSVVFAGSLLGRALGSVPERFPRGLAEACVAPHAAAGARAVEIVPDERATPAVVRAALATARVVHVCGHGVRDSDLDRVHGIALTPSGDDDGVLWGRALDGVDASGVVTLLSSCRAGQPLAQRSTEPLGASLAGTLLAAGARCVLVPTTDVAIARHLDAMARVHAALAAGRPLAVALHEARRVASADRRGDLELLLVQVHGRGF